MFAEQIDSFLDHFQYNFTFEEKLLSSSHPVSEDVSSSSVKGYIDACSVIFSDLTRRINKSGPLQLFASLEDIFAALQLIDKSPYFQINAANVYFKTVHFLLSELMAWKLRRKTKPLVVEPAEEEGTARSWAHLNKICSILNIPAVSSAIGRDSSGGGDGNLIELPVIDRSLVRSILSALAAHSAAAERSTEPILAHVRPTDIRSEQWELINDINEEFTKDFSLRRRTLLQRLDVTVQSFLLSKNLTDESREELRKKVEQQRQLLDMHDVPDFQVGQVFAAPRSIMYELSKKVGGHKRRDDGDDGGSKGVKGLLIGEVPDRGGRANEGRSKKLEMFNNSHNSKGGGNHHGNSWKGKAHDDSRKRERSGTQPSNGRVVTVEQQQMQAKDGNKNHHKRY